MPKRSIAEGWFWRMSASVFWAGACGIVCAALHGEPWNRPTHWITIAWVFGGGYLLVAMVVTWLLRRLPEAPPTDDGRGFKQFSLRTLLVATTFSAVVLTAVMHSVVWFSVGTIYYIRQAAIGLQHAHERGMVLRDIKPHNLMVTADGTVKILDFGLASFAPEAVSDDDTVEARGDLTVAGSIMGTPDFISPEQAEDARQTDRGAGQRDRDSARGRLSFAPVSRSPHGRGESRRQRHDINKFLIES